MRFIIHGNTYLQLGIFGLKITNCIAAFSSVVVVFVSCTSWTRIVFAYSIRCVVTVENSTLGCGTSKHVEAIVE